MSSLTCLSLVAFFFQKRVPRWLTVGELLGYTLILRAFTWDSLATVSDDKTHYLLGA